MRIVSLLPSATEILALIGAADQLVGRSHECDFPPGLNHLPVLTAQNTHYNPAKGLDAAAIDRQVRSHLTQNNALYTLDTDQLAQLRPDLILTQDLCQVCSIDLPTVQRLAASLDPEPQIVSLNPATVEAVLDDILKVGLATDHEPQARAAAVHLRERLYRAQEHVNPFDEGPTVGFLEWTDPLFVAGHWTVQLIERAGGHHPLNPTVPEENAGDAAGLQQGARKAGKSITVPPEVFAATAPHALVVCPCGLTLDQTRAEARRLATQPWWPDLPAVRNGRVALVDGNQMFNRPGPRLVDAFEWLVGWLEGRPHLIPQGFPWEPFPTDGP